MKTVLKEKRVRGLTGTALGVLFAGVAAFSAATPAAATPESGVTVQGFPDDCHFQVMVGEWGSAAWCNQINGGWYQAAVICQFPDGRKENYYGVWLNSGGIGYAYCQGDSQATAAGVNMRAS